MLPGDPGGLLGGSDRRSGIQYGLEVVDGNGSLLGVSGVFDMGLE